MLVQLFGGNQRLFSLQRAEVDVVGGARRMTDEVIRSVLEADEIAASVVWDGTTWTSGADTLVLRLPARDASGVIINGVFDTVLFAKKISNSAHFFKVVIPDPTSSRPSENRTLTEHLFAITFTYDAVTPSDATQVDIAVTTAEQAGGRTQNFSLSGKGRLRNAQ
jgi:hypothetical protein